MTPALYSPEDFIKLNQLADYHTNLKKMFRYDLLTTAKKKFLTEEMSKTYAEINRLKRKIGDFKRERLDRYEDTVKIRHKKVKCKVNLYRDGDKV